jgi:hypothetical protein
VRTLDVTTSGRDFVAATAFCGWHGAWAGPQRGYQRMLTAGDPLLVQVWLMPSTQSWSSL